MSETGECWKGSRVRGAAMKDVTDTLHFLVELLERLSIPYAVMGGFAVRSHGVPRPTYDVDVTIALDRVRLPELLEQLRDGDFLVPEAYDRGWVDQVKGMPIVKLQRYIHAETLDVDLFLAESDFQSEMMRRRSKLDADGRQTWIVSPEDLVLLKVLAGRPRDLGDVADILFIQSQLDIQYMRHWAAALGISEALENALADRATDG
jgi:predicted nucleotidyltransferase